MEEAIPTFTKPVTLEATTPKSRDVYVRLGFEVGHWLNLSDLVMIYCPDCESPGAWSWTGRFSGTWKTLGIYGFCSRIPGVGNGKGCAFVNGAHNTKS